MEYNGIIQKRRLVTCIALLVATCAISSQAYAQATMTDLMRVSQAKGDQYKTMRDDLLKRHPQEWDIKAATAASWEAGIVALALNARLEAPDDIAGWESPQSRVGNIMGTSPSFISRNQSIAMAWRLEVLWKESDAILTREVTRDCQELMYRKPLLDDIPNELWQGMWENSENMLLREIAIHALASSDDPAVYDTLSSALNDQDQGGIAWAACLLGMRHRTNLDATQLILEAWDSIAKSAGTLEQAIGILGQQGTTEGRLKLKSITMDPKVSSILRARAVSFRDSNPQTEDVELFIEFIDSDAALRTKTRALNNAKNWPVDQIRPVVRHIMQNETDRSLIDQAMLTLALCYHHADPKGKNADAETAEDVRLIDAALTRIGSPEGMKNSRDRYVRIIEGYRGPLIGDKWPWERPPSGGN